MRAPYPSEFYIAHALFTGHPFPPGGTWGDITDGPVDWHELREKIAETFRDEPPTRDELKVWHFQADVAPREVSEDVIGVLADIWADAA